MLNDHDRQALRAALRAYTPIDPTEAGHVERTIALLDREMAPFSRISFGGHVTVGAVLWSASRGAMLTVHHAKLDRWYQPGGHCEPEEDESVVAAALRELIEETGVSDRDVHLELREPFDVDVHPIPAFENEPPHDHYDVRFLFSLSSDSRFEPAADARWESLAQLEKRSDQSLKRLARKLALLAPPRSSRNR